MLCVFVHVRIIPVASSYGGPHGSRSHMCHGHRRYMLAELAFDLDRNRFDLTHRRAAVHGYIELGRQSVSEPAGAHAENLRYLRDVPCGMSDICHDMRLDAVEQ